MGAAGEQFDFAKIVNASGTYDDAHRGLLKILIDRGSLTVGYRLGVMIQSVILCRSERSVRITSVASPLCTSLMVRKLRTVLIRNCICILEIDYDANELHLKGVTPEAVDELRKKLLETMNTKVQHVSGFIKLLRFKIKSI